MRRPELGPLDGSVLWLRCRAAKRGGVTPPPSLPERAADSGASGSRASPGAAGSAGSGGCQVGAEETTTGWSLGAVAALLWATRRGPRRRRRPALQRSRSSDPLAGHIVIHLTARSAVARRPHRDPLARPRLAFPGTPMRFGHGACTGLSADHRSAHSRSRRKTCGCHVATHSNRAAASIDPGFPIPGNCVRRCVRTRPMASANGACVVGAHGKLPRRPAPALPRRFGGLVARLGVAFGPPLARARGAVVSCPLAHSLRIAHRSRDTRRRLRGGKANCEARCAGPPGWAGRSIDLPAFSGGSRSGRSRCLSARRGGSIEAPEVDQSEATAEDRHGRRIRGDGPRRTNLRRPVRSPRMGRPPCQPGSRVHQAP